LRLFDAAVTPTILFGHHAVNRIWFVSTGCNTTSHASVFR
jgi:hypothetical protein